MLKAGLMEIADLFVVNKADREGADRAATEIESILALQEYEPGTWRPRVLTTRATTGEGICELMEAIEQFREHGERRPASRRRTRAEFRLRELLAQRFVEHVEGRVLRDAELDQIIDRIAARALDPYTAADEIMRRALERNSGAWGG